MDFDFSDDQYAFRDTVRKLLASRFTGPKPNAPRPTNAATHTLQMEIAALGIFGLLVPEEYGGSGLTAVDLSLVLEEFGRALVPPTSIDSLVATDAIVRYATEEQKAEWLPAVAGGRLQIALALTESDAGYDPNDFGTGVMTSSALTLTGNKILVANAAAADKLLVVARAGQGTALVLVEPGRAGISIREHETLDPSSDYSQVSFDSVRLSASDLLASSESDEPALRVMDASALAAATLMTGISGAVFDATVEYVKQRQQFGKVLGSFQAIKHRCADMLVSLDSCKSAVYYAAWAFANDNKDQRKAISIAKAFCGDASRFICNQGTQLHGGMGFTWELGLHFYLRRAKMLEYAYGDSIFHRKRLLRESLAELAI